MSERFVSGVFAKIALYKYFSFAFLKSWIIIVVQIRVIRRGRLDRCWRRRSQLEWRLGMNSTVNCRLAARFPLWMRTRRRVSTADIHPASLNILTAYIHGFLCFQLHPTYVVVTCEIKLFQNCFGLRRRPSEIILFQRVETCLQLCKNYFTGLLQLVNIFQHVHCCWNNFEIILELLQRLK